MNLRQSSLLLTGLAVVSLLAHCSSSTNNPPASSNDGGSSGGGTPLSGDGCAGGKCLNPTCQLAQGQTMYDPTTDPYPMVGETGFNMPSPYIPHDVIVPTLDDVPDTVNTSMGKMPGNWTKSDLQDFLDLPATLNEFRMDFFINTDNACDLTGDAHPECSATVVDILTHHNAGNHTIHHASLPGPAATCDIDAGDFTPGCGDATCVDNELAGVETVVNKLANGGRPHLTRFRAPFGAPYIMGMSTFVQKEVAKFGVMVGWNFDSNDSYFDTGSVCDPDALCAQFNSNMPGPCPTGDQIASVVEMALKGGNSGIVLMHGIFRWTHDALKILFDPTTGYVAKNNLRIGTVEDVICWKYGMHSWDIMNKLHGSEPGWEMRKPN